jgi:hypothetical protein
METMVDGDGLMATLGDRRSSDGGTRADCREERERTRIEGDGTWFEEHFFDPDHPIDSDWLRDAELGRLFLNDQGRGGMGAKRLSVNESLIGEAKAYMDARGLAGQHRLRLTELDGQVYAVRDDGEVIRLDHSLYWEKETGFEAMVDHQLKKMHSEQYDIPRKVIMPVID